MTDLETRFETEMVETVYRTAGRETGYWAAYFLRAIKRHGGVETARRLLKTSRPSKGLLKLSEKNRLDLAMETVVLKPEYSPLFTEEERAAAVRRLEAVKSGDADGLAGAASA
jgi:hypothetical protein